MKKRKGSLRPVSTGATSPAKRSLVRFGLVILGVCALIGVTQASKVQNLVFGSAETASATRPQLKGNSSMPLAGSSVPAVNGTSDVTYAAPNIIDLINDSDMIIRGSVKEVTDGVENGIAYTEVKVQVNETLRGSVDSEYTFRQFGLTKPRDTGDGRINLSVTPAGWSKYEVGEDAMLFLHKRASITGLQTTAGLAQGKVVFKGGNALSQAGNEGLFQNVVVDSRLLNDKDQRLLVTKKGPVNADGFQSFVKRAVKDKWIEGGKMRHANK